MPSLANIMCNPSQHQPVCPLCCSTVVVNNGVSNVSQADVNGPAPLVILDKERSAFFGEGSSGSFIVRGCKVVLMWDAHGTMHTVLYLYHPQQVITGCAEPVSSSLCRVDWIVVAVRVLRT